MSLFDNKSKMKPIIPILVLLLITFSCTNKTGEINKLQPENNSMENAPSTQIATFFTFQNYDAEEAMNFYLTLFDNSKIIKIERHPEGGPAKEGAIMFAIFELNGNRYMCSDSYMKHEWSFTPGVSTFVDCESEEQLKNLFTKLSENGKVMMPIGNYGFSKQFAFVEDRFGISWQLNIW